MAYLVKRVHGEPQRMEWAHLREAVKNGLVGNDWLVRDERQDFWYSVGKLMGTTGSQPVTLFCPRCRTPIHARKIDIGLPAACPQCHLEVLVPDPLALEQREQHLLVEARQNAIKGVVFLGAGLLVTMGSYLWRDQTDDNWILWWGPLAFGLAMALSFIPRDFQLRAKLKRSVSARLKDS